VTPYEDLSESLRRGPRRWLVTGVAGFIGSHLLERLLALGQEVVGLDNFSTGHASNLEDVLARAGEQAQSRFRFVEGDIRNPQSCAAATADVDYVLHQAALGSVPRSIADPLGTHASNVDGFVNVLIAARAAGVRRVVYASSSSVYGDEASSPKQERRIGRPLSPYAASKLVDEIYADAFQRAYGLESVGLRYFNVFGPRQDPRGAYAAVIPRWTQSLFADDDLVMYGDGSTSRDFCFVANVVEANLLAACVPNLDNQARVFNVACAASTTLRQLFEAIRARVAVFHPPAATRWPRLEPFRTGDIPHSLADIGAARQHLGLVPRFGLERGLDETVEWYARHHGRAAGARSTFEEAS